MSTEPKQVIVVRKDLGMRKGKMIAQGAHASLAAILRYRRDAGELDEGSGRVVIETTPAMQQWLDGRFTKIAVSVDSEAELVEIYERAEAAGLPCALIRDSGKTEFGGEPTLTACAVGPAMSEQVDAVTGGLKLL